MSEQNNVQKLKVELQEEARRRKPQRRAGAAFRASPTPSQAQQRLKAERVQSRLKRLPGWKMQSGGRAIDRVRQFPDAQVAVSFLAYAARLACQWDQPLQASVNGETVVIALPGRSTRSGGGITEEMLALAEQLG